MTFRRLKLLAILAPLLFLGGLELVRQNLFRPTCFASWPGYLLLGGVILLGTLFFAEAVFGVVSRLQERLTRQNRELLALHGAGLGILGERDLETLLQRVVDNARELLGARYGALSLLREGAASRRSSSPASRRRSGRGSDRSRGPRTARGGAQRRDDRCAWKTSPAIRARSGSRRTIRRCARCWPCRWRRTGR